MAGLFPLNPNTGHKIQGTASTAAPCNLGYVAHYHAHPALGTVDAVLHATDQTTLVQSAVAPTQITPDVPRVLTITGNNSGIAGNVTITGRDAAGVAITDTIALSGSSTVVGDEAFRTITSISLPIQSHVPVAQSKLIEVTGACSSNASLTWTFTSALVTGGARVLTIPVTTAAHGTRILVAAAIVAAMAADGGAGGCGTHFTFGSTGVDEITATARVKHTNDGTLQMALTSASTSGVTVGASSNSAAGVDTDTISVGTGAALGLIHKRSHNTTLKAVFNNVVESLSADVVDATNLSGNLVTFTSVLDGSPVDIYYVV